MNNIRAVIFDLGGVLFDWNPEYLYQKLISSPQQRAWFLREVCSPTWNAQQDAGRSIDEATESLVAQFPHYEDLIRAYYQRWPEMLIGPLAAGVAIQRDLHQAGIPLYALSNWSAQTFAYAEQHHAEILTPFQTLFISGRLHMAKPDPKIFQYCLDAIGMDAPQLLFIDDDASNIQAAQHLGFNTLHYSDPKHARQQLQQLALLPVA